MRAKEGHGGACCTRTHAESGSAPRRKATPTGGARLAVRQRGEGGAGPDWARGGETGRCKENGPREKFSGPLG